MLMPNQLVLCDMQKCRLYLKRLSAVASQQASIVAAFGGRDPSFLHMGAFEGLQSYQPFAPCSALSSFSPHGLLGDFFIFNHFLINILIIAIPKKIKQNKLLWSCHSH